MANGAVNISVPTGLHKIAGEEEAREFARFLQVPHRAWPVVVISTPAGRTTPYVDPQRVLDDVAGLAEVVVIPTGDVSWAFSRGMPEYTQVYGGASRVYPTGLDWVHDLRRSPLHFAYSLADGPKVRERLVSDALSAAVRAGLTGAAGAGGGGPGGGAAEVRGTVQGVLGSRALIELDDGGQASVAEELTLPGVPLQSIFRRGMKVRGRYDAGRGTLDARGMLPDDAAQRRAVKDNYRVGKVVVGRVEAVTEAAVTIAVAPAVHVRVPRERVTGNALDALDDLFTPGEVVLARVVQAPGDAITLRLDDVDESDEPLPALSLLDGGPPWLLPPDPSLQEPEAGSGPIRIPTPAEVANGRGAASPRAGARGGPEYGRDAAAPDEARNGAYGAAPAEHGERRRRPTPGDIAARIAGDADSPLPAPPEDSRPIPAPGAGGPASGGGKGAVRDLSLALDAQKAQVKRLEKDLIEVKVEKRRAEVELDELRRYVADLRDQVDRRDQQLERSRAQLRAEKSKSAAYRRELGRDVEVTTERYFSDPAEQFRFEVTQTWAQIVPAGEKDRWPLEEYVLGPRFLESLETVEGISRDKVLRTVVHVVTGRAPEMNGLQVHPLRSGLGGDDPQRVRDDGAACWRVSLQVNTPSARRMHYWRLPGGGYELSRVVLHDDMEP
ncbi:hypothetical protein [Myceligenerans pegani]|uniref:S1 motif domain-containing protein n=1 Tax=Myceligenerans pegani TaxID=2776917 RepID=A0ABR9MUM0_9MICO|nr:hypothetical protein [Myceligenerans sp. TRM 65318]MBE1874716.1 hypothetical protein [Myceligenerans sp. TRM 65318]MBE3016987.1 hypothetical protein [Myceligenerans sp. TRM 65318]